MKQYGWIPHLGPSLTAEIPSLYDRMGPYFEIYSNDMDVNEVMLIGVTIPAEYEFGDDEILCSVDYGGIRSEVCVKISPKGLMSLETTTNPTIEEYGTRNLLKEIYREFKRVLHTDTHDIRQSGDSLNGSADLLTLSHSGDKKDSVEEIGNSFIRIIRTLNDGLSELTYIADEGNKTGCNYLVHDHYRKATGFVVYARNYANLFFPSNDAYITSLDIFQRSLDSMYEVHCNDDVHKLNSSLLQNVDLMGEQNEKSSEIANQMRQLTIIMAIISFISVIVTVASL